MASLAMEWVKATSTTHVASMANNVRNAIIETVYVSSLRGRYVCRRTIQGIARVTVIVWVAVVFKLSGVSFLCVRYINLSLHA